MDTRRRLILLSASALPVLLGACAGAPLPRLAITTPRPIVVATFQPIVAPPVLTRVAMPKLAFRTCRSVHRATAAQHRKAPSCAGRGAELQVALPKPERGRPELSPSPSQSPRLIRVVERRLASVAPRPALISFQAGPAPAPTIQPRLPTLRPLIPIGPVDHMEGAARVFAYSPGRLYPVRAEPLRVTLLSLQPGETLIDKAAGDTVRWQIGDTTSGEGAGLRSLVVIKPLTTGLSTNLVLTTSKRVYLIELSSVRGGSDPAIAWAYPAAPVVAAPLKVSDPEAPPAPDSRSGRYRIAPVGRRPAWTPATVFDDERRTYIAFTPDLEKSAAPLLFVTDGAGAPTIVNYRQRGDVFIVDRLFDAAELRLGDKKPQVVRITRVTEVASR